MMSSLQRDGCLYQEDVVDYLIKEDNEQHLKENADGNQALSTEVIKNSELIAVKASFGLSRTNTGDTEFLRTRKVEGSWVNIGRSLALLFNHVYHRRELHALHIIRENTATPRLRRQRHKAVNQLRLTS